MPVDEQTVELPRARTLRVLIVEDEPRLRDLLLGAVPEMGFPAAGARTAEDALRMMRADPQEIVILDLQLPLMSGMEFFEQVHKQWPATQVIVLTGYGDLPSARRAIQLEVVEFLSKPCHLHEIESALSRARMRRLARDPLLSAAASEMNEANVQTLAQSEYHQIIAALRRHAGNRTAAAQELGISRRTLHYRLVEYQAQGLAIE